MDIKTSLEKDFSNHLLTKLALSNKDHQKIYPGESYQRQPAHVVYGGAHLFTHNIAKKMSERSLQCFRDYAPHPSSLQKVLDLNISDKMSEIIHERVHIKLEKEALEDFRIDFEDGFGNRLDEEEDQFAFKAAVEVAKGIKEKSLPPFIGIRIKPLSEDQKARSFRTLDIFLTTLINESKGILPENFVITLPKINSFYQIEAFIEALCEIEKKLSLKKKTLLIEIMIETPETLFDPEGNSALLNIVRTAEGRCLGAHFGTYDYTATMNVIAGHQSMTHQICDFARNFMKNTLAGTGIFVSDGATNILPIGPHKGPFSNLSLEEKDINTQAVHNAWRLSSKHINDSLKNGIYQGWDLHPAQIPIRYASLYAFFQSHLESTTKRLKQFMKSSAKATLTNDVFDDAASGQGLLNYFLKAFNCGAITTHEILETGLSLEEIKLKSFVKILKGRRSI